MRNEVRSPEVLEERRLFRFDPDSHVEVSAFFGEMATEDEGWFTDDLGRELVYLTAAEYALSPVFVEPRAIVPVQEPIEVGVEAIRVSLLKANCMSIRHCVGRVAAAGGPYLSLADVTAFSGDISKLQTFEVSQEWLAAEGVAPQTVIGDLARAVDEIERAHLDEDASSLAQAVGSSGALRLQGFLWAVKLTLGILDVTEAIDDSFQAFELTQPSGLQVSA